VQGFLLAGEFQAALKYLTVIPIDDVIFTQEIIDDLAAKIQSRVENKAEFGLAAEEAKELKG
jgi:hypothetical protein